MYAESNERAGADPPLLRHRGFLQGSQRTFRGGPPRRTRRLHVYEMTRKREDRMKFRSSPESVRGPVAMRLLDAAATQMR